MQSHACSELPNLQRLGILSEEPVGKTPISHIHLQRPFRRLPEIRSARTSNFVARASGAPNPIVLHQLGNALEGNPCQISFPAAHRGFHTEVSLPFSPILAAQ